MAKMLKYLMLLAALLKMVQLFDLNCLQLPAPHVRNMQICCHFPRFKFHTVFDRPCSAVATRSPIFGLDRYFNPCALACVFNASAILENKYNLNLSRLKQLLAKVLDDPTFLATYYQSFETCVPLVKAEIDKSLARGRTAILNGSKCSNLPIIYGICAHAQTYIDCPRAAWTDTRPCNETRKFLIDCMEKI